MTIHGAIIEQCMATLSVGWREINLGGANLGGANLSGADLRGANLGGANLGGANLGGAIGLRLEGMPDAAEIRAKVAAHIESHPELHNQSEWGDGEADPSCGTPCCVVGWACHLGGGRYGLAVEQAAIRLLWIDGKPLPEFSPSASRESILEALRS